jgi:hypothetical protein
MLMMGIQVGGQPRHVDLHALPIGSAFAHKLSGPDLFTEMQRLGIDGLTPTAGWMQLAMTYAEWFYEQREQSAPRSQQYVQDQPSGHGTVEELERAQWEAQRRDMTRAAK